MPGRRDAQQVAGDLRVQVGGHRDPAGVGDRGRLQEARHPADPHQVGHHQVAGLRPDGASMARGP
jgi:hypothetical protein